ncbi:MAG: M20/M25/M40 family metallo-hydrolase, partial [Thiotrichales bacterium]|nr:M20/M25/M40 family metallo-hydrolase [Thiotrichales bacterium]
MNSKQIQQHCEKVWESSILPELIEYIRVPNQSPAFDPDWQDNGYMEEIVTQFCRWIAARPITGMQYEVIRLPGRTPLILIDIEGQIDNTVLLYGHLDKQPEMTGWRAGLGAWQPVLENDRLYGRGGADDGYAMFSSLLAIECLQQASVPHGRCIVIIEACEESGSPDLPYYMDHLETRIGNPDLVVCLDSGCGNYEQLWCTTSLRGLIGGQLTIEVLKEGIHSGDAGGIVPCSFRLLRRLLERIEDSSNGEITDAAFHVRIPEQRLEQARSAASMIGDSIHTRFPLVIDNTSTATEPVEQILNRSWRPALSVIGADGIPAIESAGNVLRPRTSVKLSMRLPPTTDA